MKLIKLQNLVANCCKAWKYSLPKFANFVYVVLRAEIVTIFGSKMVTFSAHNTNIYKVCKLRSSQGYIFRILYPYPIFSVCILYISQPNIAILLICGNLLFLPRSKISLTWKLSIKPLCNFWIKSIFCTNIFKTKQNQHELILFLQYTLPESTSLWLYIEPRVFVIETRPSTDVRYTKTRLCSQSDVLSGRVYYGSLATDFGKTYTKTL
jgi:hypothetical protein